MIFWSAKCWIEMKYSKGETTPNLEAQDIAMTSLSKEIRFKMV